MAIRSSLINQIQSSISRRVYRSIFLGRTDYKKINKYTTTKKNEQNKQKGLVWLILENYQILTYFMFYAIIYFAVIKAL